MIDKKEIENILKKYRAHLKENYYVERIGLFGSFSRGEQTPESDIDIIVEFNGSVGWKFFTLKDFLENILGRKIDLVTKNSLRDEMKAEILDQVIYI
jgi:hypothetical protein